MFVRFHGVRGSIPTADSQTWRYGGNTSCVEVETPGGHRIVIDGGTGLRRLGRTPPWAGAEGPIQASVLLSHYHWDHIQGLPFFPPLYDPRNRFEFFGLIPPDGLGMETALQGQMIRPYFPVSLSVLAAARSFTGVPAGSRWAIHDATVETAGLNHPQGSLGFRIETDRGVLVYATDHEPGDPPSDAAVRRLARDADVLVYDAQYSPALLDRRRGWGHSSWQEGVRVARDAGARLLLLFHHDPDADDARVDGFVRLARGEWAATWAAAEGLCLSCRRSEGARVESTRPRLGPRVELQLPVRLRGRRADGSWLELAGTLSNLTLKGGCLVAPELPDPASDVEIVLADGPDGRRVTGQVVRLATDPGTGLPALGIVFGPEAEISRPPAGGEST